jgi:hypothetical protein
VNGTPTGAPHFDSGGDPARQARRVSMAIDDDGVRASSTERREAEAREHPTTTVGDRRGSRTRIVLGSLLTLLVVAAVVYYFAGHRTGTEVAIAPSAKQSSESDAVPTPRRAADSADHPVASTSPQPDPSQSPPAAASPQQSPTASPRSVTAPEEMRKDPPAAAAQNATSDAPTETNEGAAKPSESSGARADARTGAPAVEQQPMHARPTSLPDQPAAAPKQDEVISVVKRGPANIRSAPSKNARVIGTAAKDTQLREIGRSGTWVEVETKAGRGWIGAGLLAPLSRESR